MHGSKLAEVSPLSAAVRARKIPSSAAPRDTGLPYGAALANTRTGGLYGVDRASWSE